jgi:hypothetical protein
MLNGVLANDSVACPIPGWFDMRRAVAKLFRLVDEAAALEWQAMVAIADDDGILAFRCFPPPTLELAIMWQDATAVLSGGDGSITLVIDRSMDASRQWLRAI